MSLKFKIENMSNSENTIIYDVKNKGSIMVKIPKFYLDEVITGASHTVHPAFIVNGVEKPYFYVSKYQNTVDWDTKLPYSYGGVLATKCSLDNPPKASMTLDSIRTMCNNKGAGWHLMTNAEYSALLLLSLKNSNLPLGNTNSQGSSPRDLTKSAMVVGDEWNSININASQPKEFSHNGTTNGVFDICGNLSERVWGIRVVNFEIQVLENNNAASSDTNWKAILSDGSLVAPGTTDTLKFTANGIGTTGAVLPSSINLKDMQGTVPNLVKALCLFPTQEYITKAQNDMVECATGEKYILRGGANNKSLADRVGAFTFMFQTAGQMNDSYGFRACYIE